MNIKFKPLGDRVLIQPDKVIERTASGLIIPSSVHKEIPVNGTIVAMGPGKGTKKMNVKLGDRVLYSRYTGSDVRLGGETYLIMREEDIFGINED